MTTYDPETLDWKTRAERHETPYDFQVNKSVDIASAIGLVQDGEFLPVREVPENAWCKIKVINRAVKLRRPINLETVLEEGYAKWLNNSHLDEVGRMRTQIVLRRSTPGAPYFHATHREYPLYAVSAGFERAVTTSDLNENPLESAFYCRVDKRPVIHKTNGEESEWDVGIITIRAEEYTAILERLPHRKPVNKPSQIYEGAEIQTRNGDSLRVALARCLHQGPLEASAVAMRLLSEINPRWIILLGIAGGLPSDEFSLGDVVVASRYVDFCLTGAVEGSLPEQNVSGGSFHPLVEKLLMHLPADREALEGWSTSESITLEPPELSVPNQIEDPVLYGDDRWKARVIESLQLNFGQGSRVPHLYIAPTASSGVVLKDTNLASEWKKFARSVVNVETELAGVYKACCASHSNLPRILAIRGISDIVGYRRSHLWLNYACNSAAAFAMALFQAGLIGNAEMVAQTA